MLNLNKKNKVLIFFISLLGGISPLIIAYSFSLIGNIQESLDLNKLMLVFVQIIGILLIGVALEGIFIFFSQHLVSKYLQTVKNQMYNQLLKMNNKDFYKKETSFYINLLTKKEDIIRDYYFMPFFWIQKNLISFCLVCVLITVINPIYLLGTILFLVPLIINNVFFPKKIGKKYDQYMEEDIKYLSLITETISGFVYLKNTSSNEYIVDRMNPIIKKNIKSQKSVMQFGNLSSIIAFTLVYLLQFGLVFVAGYYLINKLISFSIFLLVVQLCGYITTPVVSVINDLQMKTSIKGIVKEFNEFKVDDSCFKSDFIIESIELNKIKFSYDEFIIFNELSFKFARNCKYLILGESGCGKTTLMRILNKEIMQSDGDVILNGSLKLSDCSERELYNNIYYVPQEVFIFSDTLENNIFLGIKHDISEFKMILEKCKLNDLYLKHKDCVLNGDFENVSGGEKSRIALARAIASKKEILLFDEILSALDRENATLIEDMILNIDGKMILNICHKNDKQLEHKYDGILNL